MIVRPPQKKSLPKLRTYPTLSQKVANDNQPPKKFTLSWLCFGLGICLLIMAFLWI